MKLNYKSLKLNQLILLVIANVLLVSCGTYQSVYNDDGIYGDNTERKITEKKVVVLNEDEYEEYEDNYFTKSLNNLQTIENNEIFVDVDDYNSDDEIIDEDIIYDSNEPWGFEDNDVVVNVNLINDPFWYANNSWWGFNRWGYNNWGFYGDPYWGSPFWNRPYWGNWGYSSYWGPFRNNWRFINWNRFRGSFNNRYWLNNYRNSWANRRSLIDRNRIRNYTNSVSRNSTNRRYAINTNRNRISTSTNNNTTKTRRSTTIRRSSNNSRNTNTNTRRTTSSSRNNSSNVRRSSSSNSRSYTPSRSSSSNTKARTSSSSSRSSSSRSSSSSRGSSSRRGRG